MGIFYPMDLSNNLKGMKFMKNANENNEKDEKSVSELLFSNVHWDNEKSNKK